jgi:hypothetical protein
MPTYEEYEQSVEDSSPIECYKFVGSFKTYYYTSADRQILLAGNTYLPIAVTRSRVKSGTQDDDNLSLDLAIPFDIDVVQDYAFAEVPPNLALEVYRSEADDPEGDAFILFWKGVVHGFSVKDRLATVQVPSTFATALQGEIPAVFYQVPCNKTLYDNFCQVVRSANAFAAVVQAVDSTAISLVGVPTTNGDLAAGEILNLRNGERRKIFANVGTLITIGYPFVDIVAGDDVELVRGCNHEGRNGDCKNKFNNYVNFGGFEDIPPDNPFVGDVG